MQAQPFRGLCTKQLDIGDRRCVATVPCPIHHPYLPELAEGVISQEVADKVICKSWALLASGQNVSWVHTVFLELLFRRTNESMRANVAYPMEFAIVSSWVILSLNRLRLALLSHKPPKWATRVAHACQSAGLKTS